MCVCVCVCVRERERERDKGIISKEKLDCLGGISGHSGKAELFNNIGHFINPLERKKWISWNKFKVDQSLKHKSVKEKP